MVLYTIFYTLYTSFWFFMLLLLCAKENWNKTFQKTEPTGKWKFILCCFWSWWKMQYTPLIYQNVIKKERTENKEEKKGVKKSCPSINMSIGKE